MLLSSDGNVSIFASTNLTFIKFVLATKNKFVMATKDKFILATKNKFDSFL